MMLAEFEEVIVVDWSCPQNSGSWAKSEGATVVRRTGEKYWNASRARNLGSKSVATSSVCFLDADTMVMPGTRNEIEGLLDYNNMVFASRRPNNTDVVNLNGFIAVDMSHFRAVGGYNETLEGYAIEDGYLRAQLRFERGLKVARVSPGALGAIQHPDKMRVQFQREPIEVTGLRNLNLLFDYMRSKGVTDWQNDPRTADMAYR